MDVNFRTPIARYIVTPIFITAERKLRPYTELAEEAPYHRTRAAFFAISLTGSEPASTSHGITGTDGVAEGRNP